MWIHGKYSKRWLESDRDVEAIYIIYKPGDEITLWRYALRKTWRYVEHASLPTAFGQE